MNYEREILKVLYESGGQGLSVKKICVHVYNSQKSLFDTVSYEDVRKKVVSFLQQNSKRKSSLLSHTAVRGHYCINQESNNVSQLMLQFDERESENDVKVEEKQELSLSLFD